MKVLLLIASILTTFSSFAGEKEIQRLSAGARAQAYQDNGIIVSVTGETAKYMYLRGLDQNGVYETYRSESGSYNTTTVMYGTFRCTQSGHDFFSFIPGETNDYSCSISVTDYEI